MPDKKGASTSQKKKKKEKEKREGNGVNSEADQSSLHLSRQELGEPV